jgi:hypothetical protein
MTLYLNCDKNLNEPTFNKADYLLRAAQRMGKDVYLFSFGGRLIQPDAVLNIEPYSRMVVGKKWTGVWEIDLLCDRRELNESNWAVANSVYIAISSLPSRMEHMRERTKLLFQACDPILHQRDISIAQEYDFVLAGSLGIEWYNERERLIRLLATNGFTYRDFGKGVNPREYVKRLNTAKVQFIRSMSTAIANGELAQTIL